MGNLCNFKPYNKLVIANESSPMKGRAGLKTVYKVYRQVSEENLKRLYESLPRRIEAVIAFQGG